VGLLTPYAAQARLLNALTAGLLGVTGARSEDAGLVAATVHRFQGAEQDAVVLDLVDSFPQRGPGGLLSRREGSVGQRLVNVAVTGASFSSWPAAIFWRAGCPVTLPSVSFFALFGKTVGLSGAKNSWPACQAALRVKKWKLNGTPGTGRPRKPGRPMSASLRPSRWIGLPQPARLRGL